ncbi:hypothetical protein V1478_006475 [Vespula squamosa]|uniref:Uncharacterized protein n=1 Tax=Vespula squamosa TaxID=30214 RepID=A0ABD2B7Z7_VESSQ
MLGHFLVSLQYTSWFNKLSMIKFKNLFRRYNMYNMSRELSKAIWRIYLSTSKHNLQLRMTIGNELTLSHADCIYH